MKDVHSRRFNHREVIGGLEMSLAEEHHALQALGLSRSTTRSANAFKLGLYAGSNRGVTPLSRSRRRKAPV
jgi:hypothetical protein